MAKAKREKASEMRDTHVRLPQDVWRGVEELARRERRSASAQIGILVEKGLEVANA